MDAVLTITPLLESSSRLLFCIKFAAALSVLNVPIKFTFIILENNVFVGSHSLIKGGAEIGHHSIVAAGTIVDGAKIPPFSLISGNPMIIKKGYYERGTKP